jgi:aminopeptidase N
VDSSIYDLGSFRPYTDAVYLRGAEFMEDLRVRVGDEAFFAFLKDYAAQMAYQRATAEDFFRILRQHTDVDFSDIVSSYFQYSH